ncbi:MAG: hypothetical protein ACKVQC_09475 [Elusimicrobiota bacterium]
MKKQKGSKSNQPQGSEASPLSESIAISSESLWIPTWAWHLKTLLIIYVLLTVAYFLISSFLLKIPKPYKLREVPKEVRPWIKG